MLRKFCDNRLRRASCKRPRQVPAAKVVIPDPVELKARKQRLAAARILSYQGPDEGPPPRHGNHEVGRREVTWDHVQRPPCLLVVHADLLQVVASLFAVGSDPLVLG